MKKNQFCVLGLVLCWLGTVTLHSAEWAEFRGAAHGNAEAKSLPLTWSATENVKWKIELPGKGWSSPALFKDRLYLTADEWNKRLEKQDARAFSAYQLPEAANVVDLEEDGVRDARPDARHPHEALDVGPIKDLPAEFGFEPFDVGDQQGPLGLEEVGL